MRDFRFGFNLSGLRPARELADLCRTAEGFGYDIALGTDHLPNGSPFSPLVIAAHATERMRVGTLTINNEFWNAAMLAREAITIDFGKPVPLFPLAMIGGVIIQLVFDRRGRSRLISGRLMNRISGAALDFTIVAALGALSIRAIGENLGPFLLLAATGIGWSVFAVVYIAPRIIPTGWFERGIGDFGQSMGVTVTGLLLMRVADPPNRSGALESFGYKQLLFEPIVGGGLFTAASLPLIAQFGPLAILVLALVLTLAWLTFGLLYFGRMVPERGRGRWRQAGR
jgi:glutamate:Na+ symporter, ESS family